MAITSELALILESIQPIEASGAENLLLAEAKSSLDKAIAFMPDNTVDAETATSDALEDFKALAASGKLSPVPQRLIVRYIPRLRRVLRELLDINTPVSGHV